MVFGIAALISVTESPLDHRRKKPAGIERREAVHFSPAAIVFDSPPIVTAINPLLSIRAIDLMASKSHRLALTADPQEYPMADRTWGCCYTPAP